MRHHRPSRLGSSTSRPAAEKHGGPHRARGPYEELLQQPDPWAYFRGKGGGRGPRDRGTRTERRQELTVAPDRAREHNLSEIDVLIPLASTSVTRSGGIRKVDVGQRTSWNRRAGQPAHRCPQVPGRHTRVTGLGDQKKGWTSFVRVDQSPIGRTPRSNPQRKPACRQDPQAFGSHYRGQGARVSAGTVLVQRQGASHARR